MLHRQLSAVFDTWCGAIADAQSQRVVLGRAVAKILHQQQGAAFDAWVTRVGAGSFASPQQAFRQGVRADVCSGSLLPLLI
jgi:hypothetical protein